MTDITLTSVASGYNLSVVNDNFNSIEDVINTEVLHTTGGNNTMAQSLDMNSQRILNLPAPINSTEPIRLQEIKDIAALEISVVSATEVIANGGTEPTSLSNRFGRKLNIVDDFAADPTGVADCYAAFAAAVASNVAVIEMPPGTYKLATTLQINRNLRLIGSSASAGGTVAERVSGGATGNPGEATATINFTGTSGAAIDIIGTGIEGLENVHLSGFSIEGNASADGGIKVGSGGAVTKSSFRDIYITGFTNTGTNKGYGLYIGECYLSTFDTVYTHGNNDGINIYGPFTTPTFVNCISRVNNRYGCLVQQGFGASIDGLICEGNLNSGLVLQPRSGQSISVFSFGPNFYCEANCASVVAPVIDIGPGTALGAVYDITFINPRLSESLGGNVTRLVRFGGCDTVTMINPSFTTWSSGFLECHTTNTYNVQIIGRAGSLLPLTNIINNGYTDGAIRVNIGSLLSFSGTFTPALVSGGTIDSFQTCRWIRDGNEVMCIFNFICSAVTGAPYTLRLSGLPFVPRERVYCGPACSDIGSALPIGTVIDTDSTVYFRFNAAQAGAISAGAVIKYYI